MKNPAYRWIAAGALLLLAGVTLFAQAGPTAPPPDRVTVHRDLVYGTAGGRGLLLDLYVPARSRGRAPVVVWIHGGGWRNGSKDRCPAVPLAEHGYAVASVGYRLSGEAIFPAQIQDCKAAIRWLRAHSSEYGLDAGHFAVWGSSAGGHLAALVGTSGDVRDLEGEAGNPGESSRVQAVVDYFGPTDFLRMDDFPGKMRHNAPNSPESLVIGGPILENREKVARANPITYVSADDPPFLIAHGDQDPLVPLNQSELLRDALEKAGVPVRLHVLAGSGHGGPAFFSPETMAMVRGFLDQHLKPQASGRRPSPPAWVDPDRNAPAGTVYETFPSPSAGGEVSYLIYLPPSYKNTSEKRYPVIYWLHGLGGTQRTGAHFVQMLDRAIAEGVAPEAIVVLVNGMRDSMYCDSADGKKAVESMIVKDLIPHIDDSFRTIAGRSGRAIEGYSMGGFGVAHLGFKYPELFGALSIMAGALHTEDTLAERRAPIYTGIFGGYKARFRAESPWVLAERNAGKARGRTLVRIGVGTEDALRDWNRDFHELLGRLGVENEFFVVDGVGHNGRKFYELLGLEGLAFYRQAFAGVALGTANPRERAIPAQAR